MQALQTAVLRYCEKGMAFKAIPFIHARQLFNRCYFKIYNFHPSQNGRRAADLPCLPDKNRFKSAVFPPIIDCSVITHDKKRGGKRVSISGIFCDDRYGQKIRIRRRSCNWI